MNSTFFIITAPLMLFVLCVIIAVWIDMRFKEREYQAEYKLTHIGDLSYLKNHNTDKFIEEAEFILEYLKNKRYSEFHKFRYVESKHHNSCYYLVGYTSRTNTKKCFPCHNIMGNYGYPDYYLKDMDEVRTYYVDLLWRQLSNMNKEKKRFDEYDKRREF